MLLNKSRPCGFIKKIKLMILFRLLSFMMRLIASFFFVFLLQIPFKGQTLESYLNRFGQKFFVTQTLKKVSDSGAKAIKEWNKDEKPHREISNKKASQILEKISKKIQQNQRHRHAPDRHARESGQPEEEK